MGKSSSAKKKRRRAAKRDRERNLAALRGVSLLDSELANGEASKPSFSAETHHVEVKDEKAVLGSLESRQEPQGSSPLSPSVKSRARNHVEFVFPRAQGKSKKYVFDKQARAEHNEKSHLSKQENGDVVRNDTHRRTANETINDILFPTRKRQKHDQSTTDSVRKTQKKKDKGKKRKSRAELNSQAEREASSNSSKSQIIHSDSQCNEKGKSGSDRSRKLSFSKEGQISGRSVEEAVKDKRGMRPRANSTDGELNLPQGGLCDEAMVLRAHRWNDEVNYVHQIQPKGFVNLGNTCFLNATLQCLAYLPPFCQSLIKLSEAKAKLENGNHQKQNQGQRITSILCSLFQRVHGLNGNSFREGAIAPKGIVRALPSLGSVGSRNGYQFHAGRQEDAHEFLVHLLDTMHDGELRAAGINQHVSGWRDRLPVTRLDETTFIHRIFGGYFRSQVRCGKCGYRSNTYDPFLDLSLEVSKKASNSILDALSTFTRKETLDSDNQWRCSGCKNYVRATKQLTVFRPPLSLCIQLKRFTFDGGFGHRLYPMYGGKKFGMHFGGGGGSKITKPIEFPANLDLPLSDGRSCAYSLTGIVIHVGGSASSGHYTAYVKKPGRKGHDQWFNADDSFVEPVSAKNVLRQKDAYVLFYCRKEVKLEFPSPPPRGMSAEEAKEFMRVRAKARAESISAREEAKKTSKEKKEEHAKKISEQAKQEEAKKYFTETKKASKKDHEALSGPVKRISTKIHPLASPIRETDGTLSIGEDRQDSPRQKSQIEGSLTSGNVSRDSFPTVSSSQLREHLMKRMSEPPRVLLQQAKRTSDGKSENDESASSSSSADEPVRAKAAKKPTIKESPEKSDDSSSSDSESSSQPSNQTSPTKQDRAEGSTPASVKAANADKDTSSDESSSSSEDESSSDESSTTQDAPQKSFSSKEDGRRQSISNVAHGIKQPAKDARRTKVLLDGSESRGKVRVMLGPRRRRSWQSKTVTASKAKGSGFELLGNRTISKWDEAEEPETSGKLYRRNKVSRERSQIVASIEKQERSKKRKMHLDRWDSVLDQGRVRKAYLEFLLLANNLSPQKRFGFAFFPTLPQAKKMKTNKLENQDMYQNHNPKQNVFQRIQLGMQRMNKGKAKGFNREERKKKGAFRKKGKGSY